MIDDHSTPTTTAPAVMLLPATPAPAPDESDAPGETDAPDETDAPGTWEDDETAVTLFLRALFTLLAGGLLLWAQTSAVIYPQVQWNRWVGLSIVANLILPLGIVWMFFGQGICRLEWLRDQKYNAWNYGWDFRATARHLKLALLMFLPMLLVMLVFAWLTPQGAQARAFYRAYYLPPATDAGSLLWLLGSLAVYMFCWEWFFRGFLLFGMAQGFGAPLAIMLQALFFYAAHYAKPPAEMHSALAGGLILGAVAWRERSFAPAFYTHALVHLAWTILVLF